MISELSRSYADEFQRLRWELFPKGKTGQARVIQITASRFSEGVTTTSLALAYSIARSQRGEGVIVVEANLRAPSFHQVLGLRSNGSLARVLEDSDEIWSNVEYIDAYGLSVLPAGELPSSSDPEEFEVSLENIGDVLSKLRGRYRYIIVDSPPLVPFRDSSIIARVTDGVIFIVEAEVTRSQVVDFAMSRLKSAEATILGFVLNKREFHIPKWLYRFL
ncbi:MAG: CpsD/CapB family tyrosine-protein kinase [Deltaproteobacteria bacterium]|jgi:capsular exopolysaccharide synthesis family protein|nr:CpsD/CapB family tyrosine-protein kinase [Deltaproteobacteria bacterium]